MRSVKQVLRDVMTVGQLIEELQGMDPDAVVLYVCDYGDHCHTQQALPIASVVEATADQLAPSGYSQSGVSYHEADLDKTYYCEACDEECETPRCPACGAVCLNADGTSASDDVIDETPIVILNHTY